MRGRSDLRSGFFVFAGLLLLTFTGSGFAQITSSADPQNRTGLGGVHQIIGTVFAPSGRPYEGRMRIRLSTMTKGDRTVTTNESGAFAFTGLPAGTYNVMVDKEPDYEPYSQDVQVLGVRGGGRNETETYTLNIRLVAKRRTDAKPGVLNAEFAGVPPPALAFYSSALEMGKKGDYRGAVEQLSLAIKEHPTFAAAYNEMGVEYLRLNELENADEAFQKALKINPNAVGAMTNRGIANVMMKRYGEAVPILRKALEQNDQSAVAYYFLGQALANLGLFDDAEKQLLTALKLGQAEMKEAHRVLAIIYASRGAKKQAAIELETYLKLAPNAPDAPKLLEMIKQYKESN